MKRTSAGIFDHTWRALGLSPRQYPYPLRSPNASEFRTLNHDKELTTVFNTFVDKLNRHVYFPNRDEFDTWLLSLAHQAGCIVIQDQLVRSGDIEFDNKRYLVRVGNELHYTGKAFLILGLSKAGLGIRSLSDTYGEQVTYSAANSAGLVARLNKR